MFITLSGVRIIWNFATVSYSLHKCSETKPLKITIHRLRVACFPAHWSLWEQKNLPSSSLDLNLVNVLLWRALRQNCIRKTSEILIIYLKHILLYCWV